MEKGLAPFHVTPISCFEILVWVNNEDLISRCSFLATPRDSSLFNPVAIPTVRVVSASVDDVVMGAATNLVDSKTFPAGLRVLVVDDDLLCLKVVEKMLKTCKYRGAYVRLNHRIRRFRARVSARGSTRRREAGKTSHIFCFKCLNPWCDFATW